MSPKMIFDQANSFYICSARIRKSMDDEGRPDLYSAPLAVNLAFGCELYLKALLAINSINSKRLHRLDDLFELLPTELQNDINSRLVERYPEENDAFGRKMIEVVANSFIEWRYCYEYNSLSCKNAYLTALADTLQDECSKILFAGQG